MILPQIHFDTELNLFLFSQIILYNAFQVGFVIVRSIRRSNKSSNNSENVAEVEGEEEAQIPPSEEQPGPSNVVRFSLSLIFPAIKSSAELCWAQVSVIWLI